MSGLSRVGMAGIKIKHLRKNIMFNGYGGAEEGNQKI